MAFQTGYITSIFGRRLGLQTLSSAQSGGTRTPPQEYLVGPDAVRALVSTVDTTSNQLYASGISLLSSGLSADTTAVFRLDPPVPGTEKTLIWLSTTIGTMGSKIWVTNSTGGGAGFQTSAGSSFTCVASSAGAVLKLVAVTTALWATVAGATLQGFSYSTTT